MDLSIKNLNFKKINFSGTKSTYDNLNIPVQLFIFPKNIKPKQKAVVEISNMVQDKKTGAWNYLKPVEYDFNGNQTIDIEQDKLNERFAYRFKLTDEDKKETIILDNARNQDGWNIIVRGQNQGVMPNGGSMYHVFLDSSGKYNPVTNKIDINPDFDRRTHFNKVGGETNSLIYLLENTDEFDPYKYIISTPDIGADKVSSHKYWPNNLYQCNNMQDFKDFNWKLFKKGKGYVADIASTSQSIASPIMQHIYKWGVKSPLYDMVKVDGDISIGVLSNKVLDNGIDENTNYYKNAGIRIINPKWTINPEGKDYDNSKPTYEYDSTKPTYIQFYDKRLLSQEKIDSNEVVISNDIPNPKDTYDISSHQDSVQPFAFEVDPDDERFQKEFGNTNHKLFEEFEDLDDFLTFPNVKYTIKEKKSGANFWDGNADIVKLNLSNPVLGTEKGFETARNYLYGVATFWSEAIQSDFILRAAKANETERKEIAKNNNVDYDSILLFKDDSESLVLNQAKEVEDYVAEFPMQSIETSPELSPIFIQPAFREEFFNPDNTELIEDYVNNIIDKVIGNTKQFSSKEYRQYVVKVLANEIIRDLLIALMNPEAIDEEANVDLDILKNVTLPSMLNHKPYNPTDERKQVVKKLKDGLNNALKDEEFEKTLINHFKNELKGVKFDDFRIAESLVLQSKAGLNWRFDAAKDIGDLDTVRSETGVTFDDIWEGENGVKAYWTNFIKNIKKYNPSSYIIAEVTCLGEFKDDSNPARFSRYGLNDEELEKEFLAEIGATTSSNYSYYFNKLSSFVGVNPENGSNITALSGNVEKLKEFVDSFVSKNQSENSILSHTFTNNHDKPTVLHTLPLDMNLFLLDDKVDGAKRLDDASVEYKELATKVTGGRKDYTSISSKAVAVSDALSNMIDKSSLSQKEKNDMHKALILLTNGQSTNVSKYSYKRANAFGFEPFEKTIKDCLNKANIEDKDNKKYNELHYILMKDSMKLQESLWEMMNAIVGVPTLFNGTEYVQTGYETPSKNEFLGCRNRTLHELRNEPHYKEYYEKMSAISGLYKEQDMSAIRNGFPVSLDASGDVQQKPPYDISQAFVDYMVAGIESHGGLEALEEFIQHDYSNEDIKNTFNINGEYGNHENFRKLAATQYIKDQFETKKNVELQMWPIYKYDDKGSRTISVITNHNVPRSENSKEFNSDNIKNETVKSIKIKAGKDCPLEDGTILFRKIYNPTLAKFVDDNNEYIVQDGEICPKNQDDEIVIDDTVLNFYVPNQGRLKAIQAAKYHS